MTAPRLHPTPSQERERLNKYLDQFDVLYWEGLEERDGYFNPKATVTVSMRRKEQP